MYKKSFSGNFKHIDFILWDIISLELALLLSVLLHNSICPTNGWDMVANIALTLALVDVFLIFFTRFFSGVLRRGYFREAVATFRHVCLVVLMEICYLFYVIHDHTDHVQKIIIITAFAYLALSYGIRILHKKLFIKSAVHNSERSMMIVTTKSKAKHIMSELDINDHENFAKIVLAIIDEDMVGKEMKGVQVVANGDTVLDYACYEWVDEVLLYLNERSEEAKMLAAKFIEMGITIHVKLEGWKELEGYSQVIEKLGGFMVRTTSVNMATADRLMIKRLMDICAGIVGCIITGILCILVGPFIYLKSPGSIFFTQERIGKNGKKFKMYKFRSMYLDAEERKQELMDQNRVDGGLMFKVEHDPRIIGSEKGPGKGIGNFIRKGSIDEWPQFYNILKGDMSLVGTRPPTVDEWEKYDPHHRARLAFKPGLTGMWQANGRSNVTDFEEVVKMDMEYISNWSIGLDIKILLKTVKVVFCGKGSM